MNPIVALWSHPRSMSTAMERSMRERGDFRCHHEPFMYFYYVGDAKRTMPHFDIDPDHPTSYESIREMLLEAAEERPVFFKDMSYYVLEKMRGDEAFARRIVNTFLIRDPARAIISYFKLDPDLTREEIGLEAQCEHHRWLTGLLARPPVVVDAADVQSDPEGMLRAYCEAIGVAFLPHALHWSGSPPEDWSNVAGWHRTVSGAGGIKANDGGSRDEVESMLDAEPKLRSYYEHHLPFYTELRTHRLTPHN